MESNLSQTHEVSMLYQKVANVQLCFTAWGAQELDQNSPDICFKVYFIDNLLSFRCNLMKYLILIKTLKVNNWNLWSEVSNWNKVKIDS